MDDNNLVTHGLHWLTQDVSGWKCANPDCDWHPYVWLPNQSFAQVIFDDYHKKLSDQTTTLYVVRCSERLKPMSEPMLLDDAQRLADYYNDNQGEDYCIGDHYVEKVSEPGASVPT